MKIEDAVTATVYTHGHKKFLILGEYHNRRDKCEVSIVNFIKFIVRNYWKKVDIFFEIPYNQYKGYKIYQVWQEYVCKKKIYAHGLPSVYKNFKSCVPRYSKSFFYKKCPFGTPSKTNSVKVHAIDIRQDYTKYKDPQTHQYLTFFWNIIPIATYPRPFMTDGYIKIHPDLVKDIIDYTRFMINDPNILSILLKNLKIDAQIKNISDTRIQNKIIKWLEKMWYITMKDLKKIYKLINNVSMTEKDESNFIRKLGENLIYLSTILTDSYSIARAFKYNSDDNCIFYAGEIHANNYRILLDLLGAIKITEIMIDPSSKCLDVTKILRVL